MLIFHSFAIQQSLVERDELSGGVLLPTISLLGNGHRRKRGSSSTLSGP